VILALEDCLEEIPLRMEPSRLSVNGYVRDALIKEIQRARSCAHVAVDIFKPVCTPPFVSRKKEFRGTFLSNGCSRDAKSSLRFVAMKRNMAIAFVE